MLAFPALASVENIEIYNNPAFATLGFATAFPLVTSVASLYITNDQALTSLDLAQLATAGYVDIEGNSLLSTFVFPLTSVTGDLTIRGLPVATLDLPALVTVGGSLVINTLGATAMSFPALTSVATVPGGRVDISLNPTLTSISAPSWTTYGPPPPATQQQFQMYSDPMFPLCRAQALAAQVGATITYFVGDDTTATCP